MLTWVWNNFEISMPEDWEMLYFSRNPETGRCGFADRYRYRLEMSWRRVPGPPDLERMMSDYDAKLRTDGAMAGIHRTRSGNWKGIEGRIKDTLNSRYALYFEKEKAVLEVVFLWSGKKDSGLVKTVLRSIREVPPVRDNCRRWRAFGMDMLCTQSLSLTRCIVQPARVEMTFGADNAREEEEFCRFGLAEEWLDQPLRDWHAGRLPRNVAVDSQKSRTVNSHQVEVLTGRKRAAGWAGAFGRRLGYTTSAWKCPETGRVYTASLISAKPGAEHKIAGERFFCCDRIGRPE
jgi:hypothetical protein